MKGKHIFSEFVGEFDTFYYLIRFYGDEDWQSEVIKTYRASDGWDYAAMQSLCRELNETRMILETDMLYGHDCYGCVAEKENGERDLPNNKATWINHNGIYCDWHAAKGPDKAYVDLCEQYRNS